MLDKKKVEEATQAKQMLVSILCSPDEIVNIPGSDEDRYIIQQALEKVDDLISLASAYLKGELIEPKTEEDLYKISYDLIRPSCVQNICDETCPGYKYKCGVEQEAKKLVQALLNKV